MANQNHQEESFQPDNLWDRVVSGTQTYDSEESVQKSTEESPPKKKKARRPWWIAGVAVVLAIAIAVVLWPKKSPKPQPQPEELVTVWVRTETVTYDNNGDVMQKYSDTYDDKGCLILQTEHVKRTNQNTSVEYTYDEAQRLRQIVRYSQFGEKRQQNYTYDIWGNLIAYTTVQNGKVTYSTYHTYDLRGNEIQRKTGNEESGFTDTWYTYDDAGNLIEYNFREDDEHRYRDVYTYDAENRKTVTCQYYNGQLESQTLNTYNLDGQLAVTVTYSGESTYHTLYYYDDHGNCTQTVNQDSSGWIIRTTRRYDTAGNKLEEIYESGDEVIYHSSYLYDKNGAELMSVTVYEGYSHQTYTTYDDAGNKTRILTVSANDTEEINFTYDAYGNCVEMSIQGRDGVRKTTYAYTQLTVTPQRAEELRQTQKVDWDIIYGTSPVSGF